MDKLKCSPWPWTVRHDDKWPFNIVTTDANGDEVATDRLCGHSSRDKTIADAMSACHFKPEERDRVRLANETALANAVLRGAAPELLEALQMALEWIDAVPSDVSLPAMPGFDRDWVNDVVAKATGGAQ